MKQLVLAILLSLTINVSAKQAVVTFYWPGEDGGRYSCDGKRLSDGDAAVNFNQIPQGAHLTLQGCNGSMDVTANDCGGSAVIARKAAHERGFDSALVIDVWAPNQATAREMERSLLGKQIGRGACQCTVNYVPPRKIAVFKRNEAGRTHFQFYAMTTNPVYSSKSVQHDMLAYAPRRRTTRST